MKKHLLSLTLLFLSLLTYGQEQYEWYITLNSGGNFHNSQTWSHSKVPELPLTKQLRVYGNVVFDKASELSWKENGGGQVYGTLTVKGEFSHTGNEFKVYEKAKLEIYGSLNSVAGLNVNKGGMVVVRGDLNLSGTPSTISGNVVVMGNCKLDGLKIDKTGNLVVNGNVELGQSNFKNEGDIYMIGNSDKINAPSWLIPPPVPGTESELLNKEKNDNPLIEELANLGLISLWNGEKSDEWEDKNNWITKKTPLRSSRLKIVVAQGKHNPIIRSSVDIEHLEIKQGNVTVASGGKLTIDNDIELKNGSKFIIENDLDGIIKQQPKPAPTSFIHKGKMSGGKVTVKTNFPILARNWYLAMPVGGDSKAFLDEGFSLWTYNHTNKMEQWDPVKAGDLKNDMTVYIVNNNKPGVTKSIVVEGGLVNEDVTVKLSTAPKNGFNLIANPYTAYIDPANFDFSDLAPTIWFRTVNENRYYQFDTYNKSSNVALPRGNTTLIAPMQGFWVRAWKNREFTIKKEWVTHGDNNGKLKSSAAVNDVLYLQLNNSFTYDQLAIAVRPHGTLEYNNNDSGKKMNSGVVPNFYSIKSGEEIAISIVPSNLEVMELDLGYSVEKAGAGSMTIAAINKNEFAPDTDIILLDKETKEMVDLRAVKEFRFDGSHGVCNNRFALILSRRISTGVKDDAKKENAANIYIKEGKINILIDNDKIDNKSMVNIYNIQGFKVTSKEITDQHSVITMPNQNAMYIVEVLTNNQIVRKKVTL